MKEQDFYEILDMIKIETCLEEDQNQLFLFLLYFVDLAEFD